MRVGLLLSFIALVGCGSGSDKYSRGGQALELLPPELPVTIGLTGDTFSVDFSGEDADLSFAVDTASFDGPFITGGGWIPGNAGGKAAFGFIAHSTGGHLVLIDHSVGVRVSGTVISSFTEACSGQAQFDGTDQSGFGFQVNAADNAEPGAGRDTFIISGAYSNPGPLLGGGNIQVHGCH